MKPNTLRKITDSTFQLVVRGTPAICPFRSPVMMPKQRTGIMSGSANQEIEYVPLPCTTNCPLMSLSISPGTIQVALTCGNSLSNYNMSIENVPKPILQYFK